MSWPVPVFLGRVGLNAVFDEPALLGVEVENQAWIVCQSFFFRVGGGFREAVVGKETKYSPSVFTGRIGFYEPPSGWFGLDSDEGRGKLR